MLTILGFLAIGPTHWAITAAFVVFVVAAAIVVAKTLTRGRKTMDAGQGSTAPPAHLRLAVAALIVSILGVFPNLIVLPVVAIVLAGLAGWRIRRSQGRLRGYTAVVVAVILGGIGLLISAILMALPFAQQHSTRRAAFLSAKEVVQRAQVKIDKFVRQHGALPDDVQKETASRCDSAIRFV